MPTAQTWRSWSTVASTRTTSAGGRRQGSSRGPAAGGPDRRPRYDDFDNRSRRRAMATDLTIALVDRPGSLAKASDVLGPARRAMIDSGFEIQAERTVVRVPVENKPGEAARILRRLADAEVNVYLLYTTLNST